MSKIRHQSHALPEATVATARYGLAVVSADNMVIETDETWSGFFQALPDDARGVTLVDLARMAVQHKIVNTGYLSASDWCDTFLTWWKHGGATPFLVQLNTGCAVNLQCSKLNEEARMLVAIEVMEDGAAAPAVPRVSGLNAETSDKIYAMMELIGAATHGLSSSELTTEQAAWLDAICDAGEAVVSLVAPDMSTAAEGDLRQVG